MAWCLTHLSFILTWMVITLMTIPIWREIADWAQKQYPHYELLDALMTYLFFPIEKNDEEDEYLFQETIEY